jgi:Ca2+-binding EF-hand superfamily protein
MIWEVDEDLDGYVSEKEFMTMYKRCISDKTDLEPKGLFNLVQFLMYDKTFKGRVTVEETLQILFVRYGRDRLDDEIKAIFGDEEKNADGTDKEITFGEYVTKIDTRALRQQQEYMKNKLASIKAPNPENSD